MFHLTTFSFHHSVRPFDLRHAFKAAGFDSDPEKEVFNELRERALGNISWVCINYLSLYCI